MDTRASKRHRGGGAGGGGGAGATGAGGSAAAVSLDGGSGEDGHFASPLSDGVVHLTPGYGAGYEAGFLAGLRAASQVGAPPVPGLAVVAAEGDALFERRNGRASGGVAVGVGARCPVV
jgi:hypothetical protein